MNKATWASIISAAAIMAPAGAVLADSNDRMEVKLGAGASLEQRVNAGDIDADGRMEVNARANATGGRSDKTDDDSDGIGSQGNDEVGRMDGEHRQDAVAKTRADARADAHATSGEDRKGFGKGGIRAFLSFFFGLPASTTVGELRAEMTATTSASASKSEGLGFWARLFGAFRFGGGKDN